MNKPEGPAPVANAYKGATAFPSREISIGALTAGWAPVRLAAPPGADVVQGEHGYWELSDGAAPWTVLGIEPVKAVLGPQAEALLAAYALANKELNNLQAAPGSPEEVFGGAVNEIYADPALVHRYRDAATDALEQAGADTYWWSHTVGCVYGDQLLALAARDLIGTTPQWTQASYDLLTFPWLKALGPIHPDDGQAYLKHSAKPSTATPTAHTATTDQM